MGRFTVIRDPHTHTHLLDLDTHTPTHLHTSSTCTPPLHHTRLLDLESLMSRLLPLCSVLRVYSSLPAVSIYLCPSLAFDSAFCLASVSSSCSAAPANTRISACAVYPPFLTSACMRTRACFCVSLCLHACTPVRLYVCMSACMFLFVRVCVLCVCALARERVCLKPMQSDQEGSVEHTVTVN